MNAEQHRILVALEQGARLEQALGDDESWVLENEWLDPAAPETLFVGDQDSDCEAARNAGIPFAWAKDFFGWT